ncbi:sugar ABC transporter permease [Natrialba sp. INN-245]|uniref:carbohydrate ABC transporter permease n=1 Tax=Natrialba sp. INN-245 TaxID=2690967 RepID=UPI001312F737|nr:sugar ABC transporter permease [Natrialba sp. INN-245]MWV38850.1 ABC transporter permease subunit [Natrialba sp. INN-245]
MVIEHIMARVKDKSQHLRPSFLKAAYNDLTRYQRRSLYAWLLIAPVIIWIGVYIYGAVLYNALMSFGEVTTLDGLVVTGTLDNYQRLFEDDVFETALENTLLLFLTIPVSIGLGLVIALLLDHEFPGNHLFRTIFFLPYVVMMVAVAVIWQFMFNTNAGVVNYFLLQLGLISDPISWLSDRWWALLAISIVMVWKTTGFFVVIILAGLQTIPQQIYEVAKIDSAGPVDRFRYLTLPLLKPTLGICFLVGIPLTFSLFALIMVLTGGGPGNRTHHLLTWIYVQSFRFSEFGYGAVLSNVMIVLTIGLTIIGRKIQTSQYT